MKQISTCGEYEKIVQGRSSMGMILSVWIARADAAVQAASSTTLLPSGPSMAGAVSTALSIGFTFTTWSTTR